MKRDKEPQTKKERFIMIKRSVFIDTDGTDLLPYIVGSLVVGFGLMGYSIYKTYKIGKEDD